MPGGGTLQVRTEILDGGESGAFKGQRVRISVKDTGEGFSEKALHHLFTPFFTTKESGSGLGLPIVKRIVEGLKGQVQGKNHPRGGAEITIDLQM
jgi:signal transduction histidine kinase